MTLNRRQMRLVLPVALGVALGMAAFSLLFVVLRGIGVLEAVLWPLAMALLVAYIFDPLVTWARRRCRMPRVLTTSLLFVVSYTLLILLCLWLVPVIYRQTVGLANDLPDLTRRGYAWVSSHVDVQRIIHHGAPPATQPGESPGPGQPTPAERIGQLVGQHGATVGQAVGRVLGYAGAGISALFYAISLFLLMPMYTFVFLWHFDRIRAWLAGWMPADERDRIVQVSRRMNTVVAAFFRGRLICCVLVGVLTAVGWAIVGLKFGLLLGLMVGVLNLVPFVSILVGLPIACGVALLTGDHPATMLILTVVPFTIVQALDNFLFTPMIQGKAVGLHPVTIVVVLLIGSAWMGVLGMLLAVPVGAAIKVLWTEWGGPRLRALLHTGPAPVAAAAAPADQVKANEQTKS
ncbi:MAG: hypothetical protein BIFFINMI_01319 [Phycisphaerae bacterium]|nr:hypothetical protein [Phycisphaerae bacterium]